VVSAVPALYEAAVTHQRRTPLTNRFRYQAWYWLVDIDDLPQPSRLLRLFARVDRRDHMDVRALLREAGIQADRVLMLTGARSLGHVFNPISVFWAYDSDGTRTAVVAEVHNTYGDRHAYLLEGEDCAGGFAQVDKEMYVSPFYPVDGHYRIHVRARRVDDHDGRTTPGRRRALRRNHAGPAPGGHRPGRHPVGPAIPRYSN
jgi:DUF1365 family protein